MLGAVVLAVAIIALNHPGNHSTSAGSATASHTLPASTPPETSASASARASASRSASAAPSAESGTQTSGATSGGSSVAAGKLPLVVLNNTTITGLAAQAAQTFEAGGWTVTSYGNYTNDIISTCAYYDPAVAGAKAAATALQQQFPTIARVEPKFAGLQAGPIVVVLTPDYSG